MDAGGGSRGRRRSGGNPSGGSFTVVWIFRGSGERKKMGQLK